jgi:hypothetical protein
MQLKPKFTDVEGAKAFLCVKTTTLYELMKSGEIERVKCGAKTLITVESLERYAAKLIEEAEAA